jgi:putative nucleotidyltransferase with HDIG domain
VAEAGPQRRPAEHDAAQVSPPSALRSLGAALKGSGVSVDTDAYGAKPGGFPLPRRSSRSFIAAELVALGGAVALAIWNAPSANWDLALLLMLFAFAALSDLCAVETGAGVKISGSFLAIVLAMVLLGGTPAALIGAATIAVGWFRWRDEPQNFLLNLVTYCWFPLLGGLAFDFIQEQGAVQPSDGFYYLAVFGVALGALIVNFSIIAIADRYVERTPILFKVRKALIPVLPSELTAALLAVGVVYLYDLIGTAAIPLFAIVLLTFQYLLGQLLVSEERAQELELRTRQLASLQVGLLSALLHTLDLRDRMTARHSAAVARYAKEIARAAGLSAEDQDLVHTAGLLHDVGKFIFPDRILKGDTELTEEDWNIIRMHPYQGAKIVSQIEGYGPVGEIILAHHERLDGRGYPRHLGGEEIPELARIISVADVYDVMTARDSYREPISSFEAIRELRRVSGTQLDASFVELFIQVLAGKDVRYRHGEDADFDAELALDKRVHEYASSTVVEWGVPEQFLSAEGLTDQGDAEEPDTESDPAPVAGQRKPTSRPSLGARRSRGAERAEPPSVKKS